MEQDEHYHIWRMSSTGTAWFFTQNWRGIGLKVPPLNQFATQVEAEALVAQGENDQRYRRLYQVLKCNGPGFCPWHGPGWRM